MRIAIIQLQISDNEGKVERLQRVDNLFKKIYKEQRRPQLVMLPEIWGTGFFNFDSYKEDSEAAEGETFLSLAKWAKEIGCYILGGSIVEKDGDKLFNTTLLINPQGNLIAKYRKIHLFGYESKEQEVLSPGDSIAVVETEFGVWGFTTCYDLRFPELYRKLVDKGVEVFLVVSAWPLARKDHWVLFNRTRAVENQSFLISCNCAGSQKGQDYAGHSMVVDPWGVSLATGGKEEEIIWAEINLAKVAENRSSFPALKDRVWREN